MNGAETRSIRELLDSAVRQASDLFRNEAALARAEMSEKAAIAGKGVAMVGAGALVLIPALVMVLLAVAALLIDRGLQPWLANLLTGAGALLIGACLAWAGASRFSAKRLTPRATLEEVQRDRAAVREMAR